MTGEVGVWFQEANEPGSVLPPKPTAEKEVAATNECGVCAVGVDAAPLDTVPLDRLACCDGAGDNKDACCFSASRRRRMASAAWRLRSIMARRSGLIGERPADAGEEAVSLAAATTVVVMAGGSCGGGGGHVRLMCRRGRARPTP